MGPMFRHERPQKGRLRQFHQFGAEVVGDGTPSSDVEVIALCARMWRELGIDGKVELRINNLGSAAERADFRDALRKYLAGNLDSLSETDRERAGQNPLRVLDSKEPGVAELVARGPSLGDHLGDGSRAHVGEVLAGLDALGIGYVVDGTLVRGLDYYTLTGYEWQGKGVDRRQNTICGGGRYDGLMEMIGTRPVPGTGMAAGMERILELMGGAGERTGPDVFVAMVGDAHDPERLRRVAEGLRDDGLSVFAAFRGGKIRTLMKQAEGNGARTLALIGKREMEDGTITVKPLGTGGGEQSVAVDGCAAHVRALLGKN